MSGGGFAGSLNGWECPVCQRVTVAIDLDDGTTPFMLACRATPGCRGVGMSLGYPSGPPPQKMIDACGWQWAKPSRGQMKRWRRENREMWDHCVRGGLVLSELTTEGAELLAQRIAENWE